MGRIKILFFDKSAFGFDADFQIFDRFFSQFFIRSFLGIQKALFRPIAGQFRRL